MKSFISLMMIVTASISCYLSFLVLTFYVMNLKRYRMKITQMLLFSILAFVDCIYLVTFNIVINASNNLAVINLSYRILLILAMLIVTMIVHYYKLFNNKKNYIDISVMYIIDAVISVFLVIDHPLFLSSHLQVISSYYTGLKFGPLFFIGGGYVGLISAYSVWILTSVFISAKKEAGGIPWINLLYLINGILCMAMGLPDLLTSLKIIDLPPLSWIGSFISLITISSILIYNNDKLHGNLSILREKVDYFGLQHQYRISLFEFTKSILTILEAKDIIVSTLTKVRSILGRSGQFLLERDGGSSKFEIYSLANEHLISHEVEIEPDALQILETMNEPVMSESISEKVKNKTSVKKILSFLTGMNADIAIPIAPKGRFFGVLFLGKNEKGMKCDPIDLSLLGQLGIHLGVALYNARNHEKKLATENLSRSELYQEFNQLKAELSSLGIVTQSLKMLEVLKLIHEVASKSCSVLICGESGTGKELIAKALHSAGNRSGNPFVAINCAAIPAELMESELFGHEKGAFTGAIRTTNGKFSEADGGTLFLDEIGELDKKLQSKLLRVIQEKKFSKVGGGKEIEVNVRIISATNSDLEEMTGSGTFREDLFFRLSVVKIFLPPLRERQEDIIPLVHHFMHKYCVEIESAVPVLTDGAVQKLIYYNYPGNIRELQNIVYNLLINIGSANRIEAEDVDKILQYKKKSGGSFEISDLVNLSTPLDLKDLLEEFEKKMILKAYESFDKNQRKTAAYFNMSFQSLQYKLKKFNIV